MYLLRAEPTCWWNGSDGTIVAPRAPVREAAQARGLAGQRGRCRLFSAPYPHPYSVNKFSIINEILSVFRSKFFILLEFAAESSCQRSYGCFPGNSELLRPRIAPGRIGFSLCVEGNPTMIVRRSGVIIGKGRRIFEVIPGPKIRTWDNHRFGVVVSYPSAIKLRKDRAPASVGGQGWGTRPSWKKCRTIVSVRRSKVILATNDSLDFGQFNACRIHQNIYSRNPFSSFTLVHERFSWKELLCVVSCSYILHISHHSSCWLLRAIVRATSSQR